MNGPAPAASEAHRIAELLDLNVDSLARASLPALRGQHPKHHGCVEATFRVREDIPPALRAGVFGRPQTFRALVRLSNGRVFDDRRCDAHGMAIKLLNVPGRKMLEGREHEAAQDFILVDSETFFTGDPAAYSRVSRAMLGTGSARLLAWVALMLRPALVIRLWRFIAKRMCSPLQSRYYSTVPYRLGDAAVKYAALPRSKFVSARPRAPDDLRVSLGECLTEAVAYDFFVDVQSDEHAHPIEDPTRSWSDAGAARVALAELIFSPQAVDYPSPLAENLQFSPWHTLPAHAPLGFINRARKSVYREMGKTRHARNGVTPLESSEAPESFGLLPCPMVSRARS